jgi:ATP-dependent RNA helicase DDX19/DBP5
VFFFFYVSLTIPIEPKIIHQPWIRSDSDEVDDEASRASSVAFVTAELAKLDAANAPDAKPAAEASAGKAKDAPKPAPAAPPAAASAAAAAAAASEEIGDLDDDEPLPEAAKTGLDPAAAGDTIRVQRADPNSPLYSATKFEELGLHEPILKGVYGMKFVVPSKIQGLSLPLILSTPRTDLVGQAQSGTGKTACFVLGMLQTVDVSVKAPQCMCLCPTRELARQVMSVLRELAKYTEVTTQLVLKEERIQRGQRIGKQIIVGTAGTIILYIQKRVLAVDQMRMLVLDEADEMVALQGQGDSSGKIRKLLPKTTQTLLFSATFPPEVEKLVGRMVRNPNSIRVERDKLTVDAIKQLYVDCGSQDKKFPYLSDLYAMLTIGQSVVFVQTRATGDDVARRMTEEGHSVSLLHGKLEPAQRDEVIDRFREGKSKVLITTSVLARGVDIAGVTFVVNYDVPVDGNGRPDPETYLHRIGRSGRFGRKGTALNLIGSAQEKSALDAIMKVYGRECELLPVDDGEGRLERYIKESMG